MNKSLFNIINSKVLFIDSEWQWTRFCVRTAFISRKNFSLVRSFVQKGDWSVFLWSFRQTWQLSQNAYWFFWPRYYKSKNVNTFYFQQDGAAAYKHKEVQQCLTADLGPNFLDKTMWPARSSDLFSMIIYYGDTLKIKFMQKYLKLYWIWRL